MRLSRVLCVVSLTLTAIYSVMASPSDTYSSESVPRNFSHTYELNVNRSGVSILYHQSHEVFKHISYLWCFSIAMYNSSLWSR